MTEPRSPSDQPSSEGTAPPAPPDKRPNFARDFPRDAELDELVAAFAAGNYALVRRRAPELARRATDPQVAAAAADLVRRLSPDPLALYLIGVTAVLLVVLSIWAWLHGHR
jgi:hypothetical protein